MKEVETRSFISDKEYEELLYKMNEKAEKIKEDKQVTYYFTGEKDLRIQKNKKFSKLWLKEGKIHEDNREEIEVEFNKEDFKELEKLLKSLGYEVEIKWYRKRHKFNWKGLTVCIDQTPGYGKIIEIEKMCEEEEDHEKIQKNLESALEELEIEKTSNKKFEEKYSQYKKNWEKILSDKDLEEFKV